MQTGDATRTAGYMRIYPDANGYATADVNGNGAVDATDAFIVASDDQDPEHTVPIKYDDLRELVFTMGTPVASARELVTALPAQYTSVQPVDVKPNVPDSTFVDPMFGVVVDHQFGLGFGDVLYTQAVVKDNSIFGGGH